MGKYNMICVNYINIHYTLILKLAVSIINKHLLFKKKILSA